MKNVLYITVALLLCSCSETSVSRENGHSLNSASEKDGRLPATKEDALEFIKKYDVAFKPAENFNSTKTLSRDSLEVLFKSWQIPLAIKKRIEISRKWAEEMKTAKTKQDVDAIMKRYPEIKKEIESRSNDKR